MDINELFEKINEKTKYIILDSTLKCSILMNITGNETAYLWLITILDGKAKIEKNGMEEPDVTVFTKEAILLKLANKELNMTFAFLSGQVKIKGDTSVLTQLKKLWPD
jgi:putative sterol carrier protein